MKKNNNEMKTTNTALQTFKKANKERREGMAKRAGFSSAADYRSFLERTAGAAIISAPKQTVTGNATKRPASKPTIHNVHILDASGSMMGGKLKNALQGINEEVLHLKSETSAIYTQTLVDFSDNNDIQRRLTKQPIKDVNTHYSTNARGMTALYDAIGQTLTSLLSGANGTDRYLVKIFTDGGENNSYQYDAWKVSQLIKEAEGKGFTVTFVGTKEDVANIQKAINIDATNTLVHDNTAAGVAASFQMSMNATQAYTKSVLAGEDVTRGFYSKKVGKL